MTHKYSRIEPQGIPEQMKWGMKSSRHYSRTIPTTSLQPLIPTPLANPSQPHLPYEILRFVGEVRMCYVGPAECPEHMLDCIYICFFSTHYSLKTTLCKCVAELPYGWPNRQSSTALSSETPTTSRTQRYAASEPAVRPAGRHS